jgi:hypothetical protein
MPAQAERVVDAPVVVLPEIDIVEPVAVAQPGLGAVALVQEGERGADREALIAHRRKHEHLIERQRLGDEPVEPTLANRPPAIASLRAPVRASQWRTDCTVKSSATFWIEAAMVSRSWPLAERRGISRASRTSC